MNDDVQLVREIGEVKAELSGLKAEVELPEKRPLTMWSFQTWDHLLKRMSANRVAALKPPKTCHAGPGIGRARGWLRQGSQERPFALDRWISGSHISAEAISKFWKRCHGKGAIPCPR